MKSYKHAFDFKFLELILNIIRATGHFDTHCAKIIIKPVAQAYLTTYKVVLDIIKDHNTLREKYDKVFTQYVELLVEKEFKQLSVKNT